MRVQNLANNVVTVFQRKAVAIGGESMQSKLISVSKSGVDCALSVFMIFAANRAGVGACRACRAEGEIDIMASYLLPFYLISEVAEARVDNRPKYPALGFDSNFGSFRINEQCRESSA